MTRDMKKCERILNLSWMDKFPKRVQNVIASYGSQKSFFNKTTLIKDIKSGEFLKRAENAGPKTIEIIKLHLNIED